MTELIALAVGVLIGVLAHKFTMENPMGRILMYRADDPDDPPYLMVELYDQPEKLYGHKRVWFDIAQK